MYDLVPIRDKWGIGSNDNEFGCGQFVGMRNMIHGSEDGKVLEV